MTMLRRLGLRLSIVIHFLPFLIVILNVVGPGAVAQAQVTLSTCCEYQTQFSELNSACHSTSDQTKMLKFDDELKLPNHLLSYVYTSNGTDGHTKFGLKKGTPSCSGGSFLTTLGLEKKDPNDPSNLIAFTPNGYLQVGLDYYSPQEYCIDSLSNKEVTFGICKPTCDERRPCIPKCCDYGQSWDFGVDESGVPQCSVSEEGLWEPTLYSDRYTRIEKEARKAIHPHYVSHHPSNGWCDYGHPFIISLRHVQDGSHGVLFRILQDGSVITRVRRRQWAYLPKGDYCLDRTKNLYEKSVGTEEDEDDTVILYCHKELATSEATISKVYGVSMIISSLFLVLTLVVFGLLWEKHRHNIQRWTIFSYVSTLLLMYFFFILSYFSNLFDGEVVTNAGMCRTIGIGMHFFFLSTFCWLTTLNFEIWWTVRSFTAQADFFSGFKRLGAYAVFAFGVPAVIVSVGLILESVYESDVSSEVIIPEYGRFTCNIGSRDAFWAYMYGPVGFLLVSNMVFFITTVVAMWRILYNPKTESNVTPKHKKQSELMARFGKLYLVMGVPWIFELVSFAAHEDEFRWYWIVFDLINIFQSVAIFIIFVCNRETFLGLQSKYPVLQRFLSPLISKTRELEGRRIENEEDSGKLSTVEIGTVIPKETIEMT